MTIYLETQRLRLVEFTPGDVDLLMDLDSDPDVMLHLNGGRPSTEEEVHAAMERIMGLYDKHARKFGLWKAIDKVSGDFIGWFLLRPGKTEPDNTLDVELGYRLKKKYWRRGFAAEGAAALTHHAFTQLGVKTVWAETMLANTGSQAVMKKIGLTFAREFAEDHLPMANKRVVRYHLRSTEWSPT